MATKIISTGSFLPKNIVDNDFMATLVDTNDEWIRSRTGIETRHLAGGETTTSMAVEAAKKAMEQGNILPEEIDLIIVSTISADKSMPSTACEVQAAIGADRAVGFDLGAACSGFLFALHTAHVYIQAGIYHTALVIGSETLSKLIDWNDRGTCILFGDGAGAAIVRSEQTGIINLVQKSDGTGGEALFCNNRGNVNPFVNEKEYDPYMRMKGQDVFKFAVKKVPESIIEVLEGTDVKLEEVKYFILHQANERILSSVAKRLHVDIQKFPMNLNICGNTSAASVPILLDELNRKSLLQRGDKIILSGFGGGLTWGATLLEW
jgi:3-oxoacyl-[acyl-carrier-protein] synthase-3